MKTYTRTALIAAFLGGIIIGHISAPTVAGAHGSSLDHEAHHLGEIATTLKQIKDKM